MRHEAILNVHSNVTHIYGDNEAYDVDHNLVTLHEEKVQAETNRLQAEYDAQQYSRDRATEYPAITEQLDEIYHNGIDSWKAVIKVTKDKYPKG